MNFINHIHISIKYDENGYTDEIMKEYEETFEDIIVKFRKNQVRSLALSKTDIQIINLYCILLSNVRREDAIESFKKLKKYIEEHSTDKKSFSVMYTTITYNLSKHLGLDGQYEEAIEVADEGLKSCKGYERHQYFRGLLLNKACCLIKINKDLGEAKELLKLSYLLYKYLKKEKSCEKIINHLKKKGIDDSFLS